MPYRSPARFLAPIALLVVAAAIFATFSAYRGSEETTSTALPPAAVENTTSTQSERKSSSKKSGKTYTVAPGDVLSAIAEQTGVPLETIQELNPDVDAQSLRSGQKLKLSR